MVAFTFLARQLLLNNDVKLIRSSLEILFRQNYLIPGLVLVTILMLVNWGIEAYKWRLLISRLEKISWSKAFMAVLSGVTVSFFTPNRIGEFLGRVFVLEKSRRTESSLITIVGSLSQLLVTLVMGSVSLLLFLNRYTSLFMSLNPWVTVGIVMAFILCLAFIIVLFFNIRLLSTVKQNNPATGKWSRLKQNLVVLKKVRPEDLRIIVFLSLLRYMVFTFQAGILLKISGIEISWYDAVLITMVVFLVITAIPTTALADLGVRGSVAVFLFGFYERSVSGELTGNTAVQVVVTFSLLWIINIALPAVLGGFGLGQLRFFRNNNT